MKFLDWLFERIFGETPLPSTKPAVPEEKKKFEISELAKSIINDLDVKNKDRWEFFYDVRTHVASSIFYNEDRTVKYVLKDYDIRRYDIKVLYMDEPQNVRFNCEETAAICSSKSKVWEAKDEPRMMIQENGVIVPHQFTLPLTA